MGARNKFRKKDRVIMSEEEIEFSGSSLVDRAVPIP